MKKLFLLLAGGFIAFSANAQYARKTSVSAESSHRKYVTIPATTSPAALASSTHSTGKTTGPSCFATEDFGTGTYTTLPTGWTAGTYSGPGTWHWADATSGTAYSIGAMHSTTASNGWMIFDSDSLAGGPTTTIVPSGWLQSPAYDCSADSSVRLNFEDYYQRFQDSCFVWVGTSAAFSAGTYSVYPVLVNNTLADNAGTANPTTVHINISGAAAGNASVYIRFVYYGPPGGGYSWMIDDLCLSTLNDNDVSLSKSFMYEPDATAYNGSIFNTPLAFVDSIYPVTLITNEGVNSQTDVPLTAQIFNGTTSVYSQTSTYDALSTHTDGLPSVAFDSVAQFPGYLPTSTGSYTCAFSAPLTSDGDLTNNQDTATFNVTDTVWSENQGNITGGYYLHRSSAPAISYMQGVRFDVPSTSAGDTVTGFGVVFGSQSVPTNVGAKVSVQLYSVNQTATSWTYVASSIARPIVTSDITSSTATTATWAYFGSDEAGAGGWEYFLLQPGTTYAALVQIDNVSTQLVIDATPEPNATGFSGYFGQSDTSTNDGATSFGASSIATGVVGNVPLVRLYFGNTGTAVSNVGVTNVNHLISNVSAMPNPASNVVNVTFNLAQSADVNVTLTNMLGQVVATQQITNAATGKATFNTTALPEGEYIYTLSANGQRSVGQVVVAH